MSDDVDPVEEIRAIRGEIQKKYPTPEAYRAHMKTIPSAKELLRRIRSKQHDVDSTESMTKSIAMK